MTQETRNQLNWLIDQAHAHNDELARILLKAAKDASAEMKG